MTHRPFVTRHRHKLLPLTLTLIALAATVVFRRPLSAWFTGAPLSTTSAPAESAAHDQHAPRPPVSGEQVLAEPVVASLRVVFAAYEDVRGRLAADQLDGVAPRARRLAEALHAAAGDLAQPGSDVAKRLALAEDAAGALARAESLEAARKAFGDVSAALIAVAVADPRLAEGRHVFECPMVEGGFNKWVQPTPRLENPYMGQQMLACGSESAWMTPVVAPDQHEHADDEVAHYTCPMHPSVKQATPGTCPICGMDLTAVTHRELKSGTIFVDAQRRQLIGVRTGEVKRKPLAASIRAAGRVVYDETRLVDVSTQYTGWIRGLEVDAVGRTVKKGETLFSVYSPELHAAQLDLLVAAKSASGRDGFLLEAAKERLHLLDVPGWLITRILSTGTPIRALPIPSPASGYVIEKSVVEGASITPGMRLYRIANIDRVWVEAEVYELDLPLVKVGQLAHVTFPALPGRPFAGPISLIYPSLDGGTRTGRIRIELPNRAVLLRPDMYANVRLTVEQGPRLQVPESAVLYTGPRTLVFVDLGEGRLKPQEVKLGLHGEESYEILEGLEAGDRVVTSGNFLIAAESRIRSAANIWGGDAP